MAEMNILPISYNFGIQGKPIIRITTDGKYFLYTPRGERELDIDAVLDFLEQFTKDKK